MDSLDEPPSSSFSYPPQCSFKWFKHCAILWLYYINFGFFFASVVPLSIASYRYAHASFPALPTHRTLLSESLDVDVSGYDYYIWDSKRITFWSRNVNVEQWLSYQQCSNNCGPVPYQCFGSAIVPPAYHAFYSPDSMSQPASISFTMSPEGLLDVAETRFQTSCLISGYGISILALAVFSSALFKEFIKCSLFFGLYCMKRYRNAAVMGCFARNGLMIFFWLCQPLKHARYLYGLQHAFANGSTRFIFLDTIFQDIPLLTLNILVLSGTARNISHFTAAASLGSVVFSSLSVIYSLYCMLRFCCCAADSESGAQVTNSDGASPPPHTEFAHRGRASQSIGRPMNVSYSHTYVDR